MAKEKLDDIERTWVIGIDPGLGTTAMVLTKKEVPVAAVAIRGRNPRHGTLECRIQDIAEYCAEHIEQWLVNHDIDKVIIQMETAVMNETLKRNVKTLASQAALYGAIVSQLHRLPDEHCRVFFAPVNNKTAKAVFTGDGNANKTEMISQSAWRMRPDVADREHLADAQGIASVYGEITEFTGGNNLDPSYIDSKLGKGTQWHKKWPKNGRHQGYY